MASNVAKELSLLTEEATGRGQLEDKYNEQNFFLEPVHGDDALDEAIEKLGPIFQQRVKAVQVMEVFRCWYLMASANKLTNIQPRPLYSGNSQEGRTVGFHPPDRRRVDGSASVVHQRLGQRMGRWDYQERFVSFFAPVPATDSPPCQFIGHSVPNSRLRRMDVAQV